MSINDYFEDINLVKLCVNGDTMSLKEYNNRKYKIKVFSKEISFKVDISISYDNERIGEINGYLLNLNDLDLEEYEDLYWILEDIDEDLATLSKLIIENQYPLDRTYFFIKNLKSTLKFKDDDIEKFFIENSKDIIKKIEAYNVDYMVLMHDSSKFALSNKKIDCKFSEGLKISVLKFIKSIKYATKDVKKENIKKIAIENNFFKESSTSKKIQLWLKEL